MNDALTKEDEANKKLMFEVLKDLGVAGVEVEYDGCGDSGQINTVTYLNRKDEEIKEVKLRRLDAPVKLADYKVPGVLVYESTIIKNDQWVKQYKKSDATTLDGLVEDICWQLLSSQHGGWENNDGGEGKFTINVKNKKIHLEHSNFYTESDTSEHEF